MTRNSRVVLVSGVFDLLHSGHIRFLERAAEIGPLYVSIGNDRNVELLKGRPPVCPEDERLYMLCALRCVRLAWVSDGLGLLDFEADMARLKPSHLAINGDSPAIPQKLELCRRHGVILVVYEREPYPGLPRRSTTALREELGV